MAAQKHVIRGRVIDKSISKRTSALRIEAWAKIRNSKPKGKFERRELGKTEMKNGSFALTLDQSLLEKLLGGKRSGKVYFKIFDKQNTLIQE